MNTYLVGGAVRDKLLGLPVVDRDWVVVGETPAAMQEAGYLSVGKDFPVFLHPETHEEYALARKERKTGPGYHGFEFDTGASVTLEEDLSRRDLTINAIAEDQQGNLFDPYNGQNDIQARVLRHVSPAFAEDPVRILRVAKFMARFSPLGFTVANDTLELIRAMVSSGEVDNLVAERVWKELEASLNAARPTAFFTTLHKTGALARVIPELNRFRPDDKVLPDETEQLAFHNVLERACVLSNASQVRFAAMCSGFGPEGADDLRDMCVRLRAPGSHAELAVLCAKHSALALSAETLNATDTHSLLKALDISRRPERFTAFLQAVHAVGQSDVDDYSQGTLLQGCAEAMASVNGGQIAKQQSDKSQIPKVIKQHEVAAIDAFLTTTG